MTAQIDRAPATAAETAAMRRAIDLGQNGPARGVNPQVGCVLLRPDGSIAAEGWHRGAGTPHAEVDALGRLAPGGARGLTAVVSLEPCNHTGRTGPCSLALLDAGVARVVYAVSDPGDASRGGAQRLLEADVDVVGGVLADEAEEAIRPWLVTARLHRPFVTVKWASSLDGRAAAADGTSQWITGAEARRDVHVRRSEHDAIVVGTGTVLADDPGLTARHGDHLLPDQPLPVVIGERAVPPDATVRRHPRGVVETGTRDIPSVLTGLLDDGVRSVFVEGGPTLASEFVRLGLVDDYLVYLAPTLLGGPRTALTELGVAGIDGQRRLRVTDVTPLGDDLRLVARDIPRRTP